MKFPNSGSSRSLLDHPAGKGTHPTTTKNGAAKSGASRNTPANVRVGNTGVTRPISLRAYAIEVLSPKRNFIKWEVRSAMKTVDKQLAKLDQALASDAVLATVSGKKKA